MGRILTRNQYLDTLRTQAYTKYTGIKTNEAFTNDVNWGDSWVGRMINSLIRKSKIAVNLRRIDSLGRRLESLFDELVESGKIMADNSTKSFITTSCLLGQLEDMVKGEDGKEGTEEDIPNIISHITFLIGQVKSYNLKDKEELIGVLEEFQRYLEGLLKKKDDGENDDESADEGELDADSNKIFFQESKRFLQSVVDLHTMIKNNVVRFEEEEYGKKFNVKVQFDLQKFNSLKNIFEKSKPENKLAILRQLVPMIEAGLDSYKVKKDKANITLFDSYFKKYAGLLSGMEREAKNKKVDSGDVVKSVEKTPAPTTKQVGVAKESFIFEEIEQNLQKNEIHARNAWKKVVDAYNKSGVAKYIPQIEELLSTGVKDGKDKVLSAKKNIILVCKQVLVNKKTVGKPIAFADLIKEGLYDNDMPKAISLFGKVLLSFNEDLGLAGAYGSRGRDAASGKPLGTNPLKVFVESFNTLEKTLPKIGGTSNLEYKAGDVVKYKLSKGGEGEKEIVKIEGDRFFFVSKNGDELSAPVKSIIGKVEKKQESVITQYSNFRKLFEKTEGVDYDEVSAKFDELFTDDIIEKFQIEESDIEEIKNSGKEGDIIIITGADPIIEIVRLFQRAWRMHTPGIIPSGRTNGKVSTSVFMEYEYMGDGNPGTPESPGPGPYRNIELYEKWNEAVTNILSNTKYRTTIFSDGAKFAWEYNDKTERASVQIDKSNFNKVVDEGEILEVAKPLGKILLRFINSLLMDSEMYKKDGALPKFLQEYFGLGEEKIKELGGSSFPGTFNKDVVKNQEVVSVMATQTLCNFIQKEKLELFKGVEVQKLISDDSQYKNMLMKIKDRSGDVRYLLYLDKVGNSLYYMMMDTLYFDTKNFKLSTSYKMTEPSYVSLIEVDRNQIIKTGTEFKFRLKNIKGDIDIDKISCSDISFLVESESNDLFLKLETSNLDKKVELKKTLRTIVDDRVFRTLFG